MSMVYLERVTPPHARVETPESGEDEGFGTVTVQETAPRMLGVNPAFVSMFFESREPGICVVKGADGRGFLVKGSFDEVRAKLEAGGWQRPEDVAVN